MKVCVCLHLYYMEMIPEIKRYMDNLDSYDLYITTSIDRRVDEQEIKKEFPDAQIIYTKNAGFDIYPFVCFLRYINLNNYDLVVKLHTKKDIPIEYSLNGYNLSGVWWRYYLYNSILGSKKRVKKIIKMFDKNDKLGFVGSKELIIRDSDIDKDIDMKCVKNVMDELNLNIIKKEFLAGSIFVIRAKLLLPLQERDYHESDFPPYLPRTWNELPYCLERCFGMMISAQGYVLKGLYSEKSLKPINRLKHFLRVKMPYLYSGLQKVYIKLKR